MLLQVNKMSRGWCKVSILQVDATSNIIQAYFYKKCEKQVKNEFTQDRF
jgi:hypothetical protein